MVGGVIEVGQEPVTQHTIKSKSRAGLNQPARERDLKLDGRSRPHFKVHSSREVWMEAVTHSQNSDQFPLQLLITGNTGIGVRNC